MHFFTTFILIWSKHWIHKLNSDLHKFYKLPFCKYKEREKRLMQPFFQMESIIHHLCCFYFRLVTKVTRGAASFKVPNHTLLWCLIHCVFCLLTVGARAGAAEGAEKAGGKRQVAPGVCTACKRFPPVAAGDQVQEGVSPTGLKIFCSDKAASFTFSLTWRAHFRCSAWFLYWRWKMLTADNLWSIERSPHLCLSTMLLLHVVNLFFFSLSPCLPSFPFLPLGCFLAAAWD